MKRDPGKKLSLLKAALAAFLMLLTILTALFLSYFHSSVRQDMEDQALAAIDLCVDEMNRILTEEMISIRELAYNIIGNRTLQNAMKGTDTLSEVRVILHTEVSKLPEALRRRGFLHAVYLLRQDGQVVSWSASGAYTSQEERIRQADSQSEGFSSATQLYLPQAGSPWCYSMLNYRSLDNISYLGRLVLEIDTEKLIPGELPASLYDTYTASLSSGDTSLYASDASGEEDSYRFVREVSGFPLTLYVEIPRAKALAGIRKTSRLYLLFSLALLLVMSLAFWGLYRFLLRRVRDMEEKLQKMAGGDYNVRLSDSRYREISNLSASFNNMADHLEDAFRDAYEKGMALQESESALLAAQINPHFIFNVLETINMQCQNAGLVDLSHMVTRLAQLLRGNIGENIRQKITLGEELSYVRYYMDLQIGRFGDSLHFSLDYEEESLLSFLLPRLTIQPLVENAVVHGLEPRRGLGTVSVRIWEEEDSIYIQVKDDGVGLSVSEEERECPKKKGPGNHVALSNIRKRLALLYKEEASLSLFTEPGLGTTARLILPIDREPNSVQEGKG